VLFTITAGDPVNAHAQIAVLDLSTGERATLIPGGSSAEYIDTGHLIYATPGSLRAVRFDLARLHLLGDPITALDQVLTLNNTGAAEFAISRTGSLVFIPQTGGTTPRSLVWVDRRGREELIKAQPRAFTAARLSPDGSRVAVSISDQGLDIWIVDLARQTLERLTNNPGADFSPVWTPNGRTILWASVVAGVPNVYRQAADATGVPERLTTGFTAKYPTSTSVDGMQLVLSEGGMSNLDISTLSLEPLSNPERRTEALIHTAADESNGEVSPDGHWIAYESNESGQYEIYVRPLPRVDEGRVLISTGGGRGLCGREVAGRCSISMPTGC
jgi:serine/threonine-protein kinase